MTDALKAFEAGARPLDLVPSLRARDRQLIESQTVNFTQQREGLSHKADGHTLPLALEFPDVSFLVFLNPYKHAQQRHRRKTRSPEIGQQIQSEK